MAGIKPLPNEEEIQTNKVKSLEDKNSLVNRTKTGTLIYTDDLFDAVLKVIKTDNMALRNGILSQQYGNGMKLVFYQGNPSNVLGYIECKSKPQKPDEFYHDIRIFSSILRKIFLKNKLTNSFFEDLI
jgi:hypothetical protein